MSVAQALAREVGSVGKLLRRLTPEQWRAPTRCEPMSVLELAAHMLRGVARIDTMVAAGPEATEPEKDASTYFRYDAAALAPEIVERAQQDAAGVDPAEMIRRWDVGWGGALRTAREILDDDDGVYPSVMGLMRFSEYLKTRVVEVTIHHLDLDDAIGQPYHPDAEALEICGDVLRGLLGTDLRAAGVDDLRFALIGTGRAVPSDDERAFLGPLADRLPLFA